MDSNETLLHGEGVPLLFTPEAAEKAAELLHASAGDGYRLRIGVAPGGCSGLRYSLYFDDRLDERDKSGEIATTQGDLGVVVDVMSEPYLQGAVLRYYDTINKQGFVIDNPNAAGSCSCGDSFH